MVAIQIKWQCLPVVINNIITIDNIVSRLFVCSYIQIITNIFCRVAGNVLFSSYNFYDKSSHLFFSSLSPMCDNLSDKQTLNSRQSLDYFILLDFSNNSNFGNSLTGRTRLTQNA